MTTLYWKFARFWSTVMVLVLVITCALALMIAPSAGVSQIAALWYPVGLSVAVWLYGLVVAFCKNPERRR